MMSQPPGGGHVLEDVAPVRLYYRPGAGRPMRPAWALEEIGVPYEAVCVPQDEAFLPPHLGRHPLGRTPVLEQDGRLLFESAALCLHLADEHPHAGLIAPVGAPERPLVYQAMFFAMTELEPPVGEYLRFGGFLAHLYPKPEPDRRQTALARYDLAAAAVCNALGEREFLVGDRLTVADIVTGGVLALAGVGALPRRHPELAAYLERLRARPAFQRAGAATKSLVASESARVEHAP